MISPCPREFYLNIAFDSSDIKRLWVFLRRVKAFFVPARSFDKLSPPKFYGGQGRTGFTDKGCCVG